MTPQTDRHTDPLNLKPLFLRLGLKRGEIIVTIVDIPKLNMQNFFSEISLVTFLFIKLIFNTSLCYNLSLLPPNIKSRKNTPKLTIISAKIGLLKVP